MPSGDEYRVKAAEMHARATRERNILIRAEFENLAFAYLRLADQADRNGETDLVYETPPRPPEQPQPKTASNQSGK